jgi:hypothetical protein
MTSSILKPLSVTSTHQPVWCRILQAVHRHKVAARSHTFELGVLHAMQLDFVLDGPFPVCRAADGNGMQGVIKPSSRAPVPKTAESCGLLMRLSSIITPCIPFPSAAPRVPLKIRNPGSLSPAADKVGQKVTRPALVLWFLICTLFVPAQGDSPVEYLWLETGQNCS